MGRIDIIYNKNDIKQTKDLSELINNFATFSPSFREWIKNGSFNAYGLITNKRFMGNSFFIIVDKTYCFQITDIRNLFMKVLRPMLDSEIRANESLKFARQQQSVNAKPIDMTGLKLNEEIDNERIARELRIQESQEDIGNRLYGANAAALAKEEQDRAIRESISRLQPPTVAGNQGNYINAMQTKMPNYKAPSIAGSNAQLKSYQISPTEMLLDRPNNKSNDLINTRNANINLAKPLTSHNAKNIPIASMVYNYPSAPQNSGMTF